MAKITLGPLISAASGAIGSIVFRNTRYGPIIASKGQKVASSSTAKTAAESHWLAAQRYWLLLHDETHRAWSNAASSILFSDRLSQKRQISGWQLFLRQCAWNGGTPYAPNSLPPTYSTPPFSSVVATPSSGSVLLSWVLAADPGVNVRVHVDGYRPGTTKPIPYAKKWTRLHSQTGPYAANIYVFQTSWPSEQPYTSGETIRFRLQPCAYGAWLGSPVEISTSIP